MFLRRLILLHALLCIQPVSQGAVLNDIPLDPKIDTPDLISKNTIPILHSKMIHIFKSCRVKKRCDLNDYDRSMRELKCYFELKPPGYNYECINTQNGAVELFVPPDTCEKGTWKVTIVLDNDSVYLRKEKCPAGYYQPTDGNCLKGCLTKQPLPSKHVVIINEGTSTAPAIGHCKEGFFNLDGYMYFGLDVANDITCVSRDSFTDLLKCNHSFDVLTSGKCVAPCKDGEVRNPWDGSCVPAGYITTPSSSTDKPDNDGSAVRQRPTRVNDEEWYTMDAPVRLLAFTISENEIMLRWNDPSLGREQIIRDARYYTVRHNKYSMGQYKYNNVTDMSALVNGLKSGTDYKFQVRSNLPPYFSAWSEPSRIRTDVFRVRDRQSSIDQTTLIVSIIVSGAVVIALVTGIAVAVHCFRKLGDKYLPSSDSEKTSSGANSVIKNNKLTDSNSQINEGKDNCIEVSTPTPSTSETEKGNQGVEELTSSSSSSDLQCEEVSTPTPSTSETEKGNQGVEELTSSSSSSDLQCEGVEELTSSSSSSDLQCEDESFRKTTEEQGRGTDVVRKVNNTRMKDCTTTNVKCKKATIIQIIDKSGKYREQVKPSNYDGMKKDVVDETKLLKYATEHQQSDQVTPPTARGTHETSSRPVCPLLVSPSTREYKEEMKFLKEPPPGFNFDYEAENKSPVSDPSTCQFGAIGLYGASQPINTLQDDCVDRNEAPSERDMFCSTSPLQNQTYGEDPPMKVENMKEKQANGSIPRQTSAQALNPSSNHVPPSLTRGIQITSCRSGSLSAQDHNNEDIEIDGMQQPTPGFNIGCQADRNIPQGGGPSTSKFGVSQLVGTPSASHVGGYKGPLEPTNLLVQYDKTAAQSNQAFGGARPKIPQMKPKEANGLGLVHNPNPPENMPDNKTATDYQKIKKGYESKSVDVKWLERKNKSRELERKLDDRTAAKLAEIIGDDNIQLLFAELGLTKATFQQVKNNNPDQAQQKIQNLLIKWKEEENEKATLYALIKALRVHPSVHVEWNELQGIIDSLS